MNTPWRGSSSRNRARMTASLSRLTVAPGTTYACGRADGLRWMAQVDIVKHPGDPAASGQPGSDSSRSDTR